MTQNDILRRLRYILDLNDSHMIRIFSHVKLAVTRDQVSNWLKKDDDPDYDILEDLELATFLNGLIIDRRGSRDDQAPPAPEKHLSNNMIFMKLKIALNLKAEEILEIMALNNFTISKHELSAFFRKSSHKHYRKCKDQVLRNFLKGLQLKHRGEGETTMTEEFQW